MNTITRHSDTCEVRQENTGKKIIAEIMAFHEGRNLTVVMNKSVKLLMSWNGKLYEGRMAGMDFVSDGPKLTKTQTTARG